MLENCNECSLCKVALVRCYNVLADRESRVSTYVEFSDRIKLIKCLRKQFSCRVHLISGCLQPTQLSSLPVLSNVASPSLHCKEATDNMLQIIEAHPNWPCVCWMSLSIHLHGLHLDAQYGHIWHLSTQLCSGGRNSRQLLWSTTLLLPTLLSDSQVSTSLVIHGLW